MPIPRRDDPARRGDIRTGRSTLTATRTQRRLLEPRPYRSTPRVDLPLAVTRVGGGWLLRCTRCAAHRTIGRDPAVTAAAVYAMVTHATRTHPIDQAATVAAGKGTS